MPTELNNRAYLLATCGDLWACEMGRMRAYLNTLIVSDMEQAECEARTGPTRVDYYGCDDGKLILQSPGEGSPLAAASRLKTNRLIAVLPLQGPLVQKAGVFSAFFGGTSTEKWARAFQQLIDDPVVGAVVIDADSPGGIVSGTPELADRIFAARGSKPIVSVANPWIASAAFWLLSQTDQIVVSKSGEVGSIGVWSLHADVSKMMENMGVKVTLISAGKYKTEMNPFEPLGPEALAYEQEQVDQWYGEFVDSVTRGRGVKASEVRSGFGEGRMAGPKASVKLGLADRIGTLEDTIRRLGGKVAEADQLAADQAERERRLEELETEYQQSLASSDGQRRAPYPNEHACRLREPGAFQDGTFRRVTRDHEGKQYGVIMGKLKGESTMTDQAFRYPKKSWDAGEAKSHCDNHDGSFEAASGGEDSE